MSNEAFEFYKLVCATGDREDTDYRDTFFLLVKLHITVIGGIFALSAFALSNKQHFLFLVVSLLGWFGFVQSRAWRSQDLSHAGWNARGRAVAARIERTTEFRRLVGMESVELWSAKDIEEATDPERKKEGSFANTHLKFIDCVKWTSIVTQGGGRLSFARSVYLARLQRKTRARRSLLCRAFVSKWSKRMTKCREPIIHA